MKKISKILISVSIFLILIIPVFSFAAGLVPCTDGKSCDFNALMTMVNGIINFILKFMVIPIAAIMFAYAGFSMVIAPGGEAKTKAKKIFADVVIGLILAVACWIIVKTILTILGYQGAWIGF